MFQHAATVVSVVVLVTACAAKKPPGAEGPVANATADAGAAETIPAADAADTAEADAPKPGFDPNEIRAVVMAHMHEIRHCYEAGLTATPGIHGILSVGWHINPDGTTSSPFIVSSTVNSVVVEECIVKVVRQWTFKNPSAVHADATWGFKFTPP